MKGKGKGAASSVDSSDAEDDPEDDAEMAPRDGRCLDVPKILHAADQLARRLPHVVGDESMAQWTEWARNVPTTLDEIPVSHRPLQGGQLPMPVKCLAEPSGAAVSLPVDDAQVELVAFNNREGGIAASSSKRSQKELQQSATAVLLSKGLTFDDLALESTVAIHTDDAPTGNALPGEGTPFFVADVVRLQLEGGQQWPLQASATATAEAASSAASAASAASSSTALAAPPPSPPALTTRVERLLVHYRMPKGGSGFCNDVTKPWEIACLCRQPYTRRHENLLECKARRDNSAVSKEEMTVKFLDWIEPKQVMVTKLKLTGKQQKLSAHAKSMLCGTAPGKRGAWADLFPAAKKAKKQREEEEEEEEERPGAAAER